MALINERDKYHEAALELSALYEGEFLITTDAVLAEIADGLARGLKQKAIEAIGHLIAAPNVEVIHVTPELWERAFALYQKFADKEWGMTDCLSFVVMQDTGATDALTFDRHFAQAGFVALLRADMSA